MKTIFNIGDKVRIKNLEGYKAKLGNLLDMQIESSGKISTINEIILKDDTILYGLQDLENFKFEFNYEAGMLEKYEEKQVCY